MALIMTAKTANFTLAVCLTAILSSCSSGKQIPSLDLTSLGSDTTSKVSANHLGIKSLTRENLEDDAPETYVVVRGDTLWDISDRFLKEPWRWSEIWGYNPQIYNPHLIFPGDVLALDYIGGSPTIKLTRDGVAIPLDSLRSAASTSAPQGSTSLGVTTGSRLTIKLEPRIRASSIAEAIPTISGDELSPFLIHPRVIDNKSFKEAPYVIGNYEERLISSIGSKLFARGNFNKEIHNYGVFRKGEKFVDPVSGANLGLELKHVANAQLLSISDPSTLGLTGNKAETINGDILLPVNNETVRHTFTPRTPDIIGDVRIISLENALARAGRNQIVVLNIGSESSVQPGDVFAVESHGVKIHDTKAKRGSRNVKTPNQRTGVVMVFETFDKVSYALVMESTRPLNLQDSITGI